MTLRQKQQEEMNIFTTIIPKHSKVSKNLRILDAFDVITSAGYLFVNEKVRQTPFISEFSEWNFDNVNGYDDGLDSVAGAILSEHIKMPLMSKKNIFPIRNYPLGSFRVKTDFKI